MIFRTKWAEPVTHPVWAAVACVTDKISWMTGRRWREIRQLDDYAWRRATEAKNDKRIQW